MNRPRHRARPFEAEATISSLAPGGDAVAHVLWQGERRAVFVARAAPGDRLRLEVDPSCRPARGRVLALLAPGSDRVAPACRWSEACGGCDWMHLSGEAQREAHVEHLRAALPRAWRGAEISAYPAPRVLGYRTRARAHVRADGSGRIVVGMHATGTHRPVAVDACVVLQPALERARGLLADVFGGCRGRGDVLLSTGARDLPVIDVQWRGELAAATFARFERAVAEEAIAGARVTIEGARRPAPIGDPTPWTKAPDGLPLRLPPGGFGQAHAEVNVKLGAHVAAQARGAGAGKALELHAGAGNLSVVLAREVARLTCVESDRDACDAARANLAARSLDARVVEGDADHHAIAPATTLVVLDPPRSGARSVAERLATSRVARVIYVACDAQTLGRDLALLEGAYAPESIATFEMFPQTSHAEAVVTMRRTTS
ncbi:MAG TPA: methyltransferase [Polyangiaceae bacterium]|nr:methyltransferase [Polyangiaceae bacterium]